MVQPQKAPPSPFPPLAYGESHKSLFFFGSPSKLIAAFPLRHPPHTHPPSPYPRRNSKAIPPPSTISQSIGRWLRHPLFSFFFPAQQSLSFPFLDGGGRGRCLLPSLLLDEIVTLPLLGVGIHFFLRDFAGGGRFFSFCGFSRVFSFFRRGGVGGCWETMIFFLGSGREESCRGFFPCYWGVRRRSFFFFLPRNSRRREGFPLLFP